MSAAKAPSAAAPARLRPAEFSALAGWDADDHAAALAAFLESARQMRRKIPTTRAFEIEGERLARTGEAALALGPFGRDEARAFFEAWFEPMIVETEGFVTGFYEPLVEARREREPGFETPLLVRPDDLVDVPKGETVEGLPDGTAFARREGGRFVAFHDRAAIEDGALDERALALAWIADPVDAFFVHVQGCVTLAFPDGERLRLTFAGKSGHPYTSIGALAHRRRLTGEDPPDANVLKSWLRANARAGRMLMRENRSYIFFRASTPEEMGTPPATGPVAAARVPLTPGRSLAVDRLLHTFHVPVFVSVEGVVPGEAEPFRRLMVAQETGSAIVGPARGDVFFGTGTEAGRLAGELSNRARFALLRPRAEPRSLR